MPGLNGTVAGGARPAAPGIGLIEVRHERATRSARFATSASGSREPDGDRPLVLVVDDDEEIRLALQDLFLSVDIDARCFDSTRELLEVDLSKRPGCLILDIRLPGSSGLDLQHHLASQGEAKPIIFLTGHGDIQMTVQAMKSGAVDFLTKPVRDQTLLDAVAAGIARDIAQRREATHVKRHADNFAALTPRERQVMREVASGRLNKQVAFDLGISEVTVKLHRSNVMRKMQVASVGGLVRAWDCLPAASRDIGQPAPKYGSGRAANHRERGRGQPVHTGEGGSLGRSAVGGNRR
ncbi:MAG: response regulator transcription factor [Microvirga sp.]